VYYRRDDLMT